MANYTAFARIAEAGCAAITSRGIFSIWRQTQG